MFKILISLLLLFAGVAYAAPPPTPTLDIRVEGLKAEATWSAVGATGYRLFYAPHSDVTNLKTIDMGSETQISAVLEPGTALYVAVQAYNDEGDSTPSEFKFFMIQDPDADKIDEEEGSEESQPTTPEGLAFKSAILDTPVAFVPTAEDSEIQERTIQNPGEDPMYGVAFEEGKISMTLEIAPTGVKRDSLELLFCLGDENGCDPLIIWNSQEPKGFVRTVTVLDLPDDLEKSVYVDLLMPASLAEKLRNQPVGESYEYTIYAHDVNSTGANNKLVPITKIPVVNLGERENEQTDATTTAESAGEVQPETGEVMPETAGVTEEVGEGSTRAALRDVVYNPANQHYYRVVDYNVTYNEASRAAKMSSYNNMSGSLMVINDTDERTFIQTNNNLGLEKSGVYWIWDGSTEEKSTGMTLGGPERKYEEITKDASTKLGSYIIEYASAQLRAPIYNLENEHYYRVVADQTTFPVAFHAAATSSHQGLAGSLLVIDDAAERTFVKNRLKLGPAKSYWITDSSGASRRIRGVRYDYQEDAYDASNVLENYIVEYGATSTGTTGGTSGGSTGSTSGGSTGSTSSTGTTGGTSGGSTGNTGSTGSTGSTTGSPTVEEKPPKLVTCQFTGRNKTDEEKDAITKAGGNTASDINGLRCSKKFGKNFSNSTAGIEFAMTPNVWLYRIVPPKTAATGTATGTATSGGQPKKKTEFGVRLGARAELKARILSFSFDVATIDVGLLKNRGKNSTRQMEIVILGVAPMYVDQGRLTNASGKSNWQDCKIAGTNCSIPPKTEEEDAILSGDEVGDTPESAASREAKNLVLREQSVKSEYKKTFVIGFIPVEVGAAIEGTVNVGIGFSIDQMDISTDSDVMGLEITIVGGPGAKLSISAQAGVTILIATVYLKVDITLIEDELELAITATLRKSFRLRGAVKNYLQGPYGSLVIGVEWLQPAFSIPPWRKANREKTLVSWDSGLKQTHTLLSWGDNGDEIKGDESKDIAGGGAPNRFEFVPEVFDKEPTEYTDAETGRKYTPKSWVCFYQYANFEGTPACVEMPATLPTGKTDANGKAIEAVAQEVGFDVMTFDNKKGSWNDSISSIKIWGPLRIALFEYTLSEGDDKRGSSAYWYAHEGQMEYVNYVGKSLNDKATGVLMTRITEQSNHPFKSRAETVQVYNYTNEWQYFPEQRLLDDYLKANPNTVVTLQIGDSRYINALLQKSSVVNELKWNYFPEVCFYRDKDNWDKGNYYCTPSRRNKGGGFDSVIQYNSFNNSPSNIGGDVIGRLGNNTNDWRNEVSYLTLKGDGPYILCLYDNTQAAGLSEYIWKENGDNSCFMRARMRYSTEEIDLIGMDNRMNEFQLMQDVGFVMVSDFSSSLEEAGTSSLPNSETMIARGRIDAIYRRTNRGNVNVLRYSDSASIIFVTGPITVRLYEHPKQKGIHSTFYLDEGEWDVAYLNGMENKTSDYTVWGWKLAGTDQDK